MVFKFVNFHYIIITHKNNMFSCYTNEIINIQKLPKNIPKPVNNVKLNL